VPVAATLATGSTYRVGFYVQTGPAAGGGSGTFLQPTGVGANGFTAYMGDPSGWLQVVAAWDNASGDAFPAVRNTAVPQITLAVSQ
jgi:hypothetical protein